MAAFEDPFRLHSDSAGEASDGVKSTDARDEINALIRKGSNALMGPPVKSHGRFDSDPEDDDEEAEVADSKRKRSKSFTKGNSSSNQAGEDDENNNNNETNQNASGMFKNSSRKKSSHGSFRRKRSFINGDEDDEEDGGARDSKKRKPRNDDDEEEEDDDNNHNNNNNEENENNNNNNGSSDGKTNGLNNTTKTVGAKKSLKETYEDMTEHEFSWSHRYYNIIHGEPVVSPDDIIGSTYHTIIIFAILMSIATLIVGSDPTFYSPDDNDPTFSMFEYISVGIFTVDILMQVLSAEKREHFIHMQFFIDLLSVLGFYIGLIISSTTGAATGTGVFLILRIFRLTRVLRVLKVSSAANAMQLVVTTLLNSKQGLLMLISLISLVTLIGGSVLYFVELQYSTWDDGTNQWYRDNGEESPFQSVPATFWFVIMTITTIGYGDVVPYTILGRLATMVLMLFGVLLLSFPNILIGAQFQLIHFNFQRQKARRHLGMVFRRARMIMRFVRMWRSFSVRGTIDELLDDDPMQMIPDDDDDEGELDLFGDDDDEEEEEEDEEAIAAAAAAAAAAEAKKRKAKEGSAENLLHIPEHMTKRHRHYVNFWFYPGEFPGISFAISEKVLQQGNFDRFTVGGANSGGSRFSALQFTQRLLESFSGCATADELFESFALYPPYVGANIRLADVVLMMLHLGKARHLLVFCLSRTDENFVCALSKPGIAIMRTFPEQGQSTCPCFRSLSHASLVWRRTTKKALPLDSPYGFDGYPRWQVAQALVPPVDVTNFVENLRLHSSRRNHIVYLKCGFKPRYDSSSASAASATGNSAFFNTNSGFVSEVAELNLGHVVASPVVNANYVSSRAAAKAKSQRSQDDMGGAPPTSPLPMISITPEGNGSNKNGKQQQQQQQHSQGHYCAHCIHCQSQQALVPQVDVDSMWKTNKDAALSEFVWKTDESVLEMQIEYLQNWLQIIRYCKKHPQKVRKPL